MAATSVLMTASLVHAQERTVYVYNWSDYIDEQILEDFTKETGIEVVYDVFDSNELLETKLLTGGSGYDVVSPTASFLARQIEAGVFQKLDMAQLPNAKHLWDVVLERTEKYDPGNAYSINYMWGTTGFGLNKAKIAEVFPDAPTDSWSLLFEPENIEKVSACGVYILNAPAEMFPAALNYLGYDANSKDTDELREAGALLEKMRPHVRKFHSSEYINALANGDICVAVGWSGDILQARDRAAEAGNDVAVDYVVPKEGSMMWFDQMAIPADAPNKKEAHAFLNYLMRPDVMAKASNYIYYANGVEGSKEFLLDEIRNDPAIYPDDATIEKLYTTTAYPANVQRLVTRLWTQVTTGQ
ncbi:polyamine ABC transporter substrate-binding protein [Pseudovibrio sp. SPO723]|uniref:polyamine ABC transporter substrate-binding protein n=1 Tax=Nesiotobacter zosterae TaxID=392721 RepID=UPI0029CA4C16|nr:polyamine ABC transporter substrate-binding protein [Pseudovibrio sp. SPO723]